MTALSDLLNDAKGDRSVDDLIEAAEKKSGHPIRRTFRSTIYKALEGDHAKNPREETLGLFADVFQVDIRTLRLAADKPAGELGPWVPTTEAARLDRDQRRALDALIKTIVRGRDADGQGTTNEPPDDDGGVVVDLPKRPDKPAPQRQRPAAARRTGKGTAKQRGESTD